METIFSAATIWLPAILEECWLLTGLMAPYLLLGFTVAGLLAIFLSPEMVEQQLGGRRRFWPIVKASLFGVPLPLCSCGVIPVSASLRKHGASRGAVISFLISTPQTGIDSILVTYRLLGGVFALFRPIAAFLTGIVGGILVMLGEKQGIISTSDNAGGENKDNEPCDDECCSEEGQAKGKFQRFFDHAVLALPRDLASPLLWGILLAGILSFLIPDDFFTSQVTSDTLEILILMAAGIPLYVCATASVPIAAALLGKGVSAGAVLAFLITGPGTNAATVTTIWKLMGRRTAWIYLGTIAAASLLLGLLLNLFFTIPGVPTPPTHHHGASLSWWEVASALVLLGLLAYALISKHRPSPEKSHPQPRHGMTDTVHLAVSGMTCEHCAQRVASTLRGLPGVEQVAVDLPAGIATVTGKNLDPASLSVKINKLGYGVEPRQG